MRTRTKTMIATGAVALAGVGVFGFTGIASAAQNTAAGRTTLAAAIAQHFGVKQSDVQGVIDQQHANRMADRQVEIKTKLDAAVKAGTITSAQETLIINKLASLQTTRAQLKGDTMAERRAAMKTERAELKQWISENNIPTSLIREFGGMRHLRTGMMPTTSPSPSPAS